MWVSFINLNKMWVSFINHLLTILLTIRRVLGAEHFVQTGEVFERE